MTFNLNEIQQSAEQLIEVNETNKRNVVQNQQYATQITTKVNQQKSDLIQAQNEYQNAVNALNEYASDSSEDKSDLAMYQNAVVAAQAKIQSINSQMAVNLQLQRAAIDSLNDSIYKLEDSKSELTSISSEVDSVIENYINTAQQLGVLGGFEGSNNLQAIYKNLSKNHSKAVELQNAVLKSLGLEGKSYFDLDSETGSEIQARVKVLVKTRGHSSVGSQYAGEASNAYSHVSNSSNLSGGINSGDNTNSAGNNGSNSLVMTPMKRLSDYMNEHNYKKEDYDKYSKDPVWKDLHRNAFPNFYKSKVKEATALIAESAKWRKYDITPTIDALLTKSNPNYSRESASYSKNCQRCVPTYEAMKRSYDVTAKPIPSAFDRLSYYPYDVWKDPVVFNTKDSGRSEICKKMAEWGDGARAQIVVYWNNGAGGHTFIAEQIDGVTHFIDPQTGNRHCEDYFKDVVLGQTTFCRTDNIEFSINIIDCCEGVSYE